jgi:hypothetical protein
VIEVHHFALRRHEVFHELLLRRLGRSVCRTPRKPQSSGPAPEARGYNVTRSLYWPDGKDADLSKVRQADL